MDPEEDLLDRYDRMVQTQIELLNGIDEKAATTMRLVTIITGLLLAGTAVIAELDRAALLTASTVGLAWVTVGLGFLLLSLSLALFTYVSSHVLHGPREQLGEILAGHTVSEDDYRTHLLRGYSRALKYNGRIVRQNSRRFGYCLQGLLYGMFSVSVGLILLFTTLPGILEGLVSLVMVSVGGYAGWRVADENYLATRGDH